MKKNPFEREDNGCSFATIIIIYVILQIMYAILFVNVVYIQDNK